MQCIKSCRYNSRALFKKKKIWSQRLLQLDVFWCPDIWIISETESPEILTHSSIESLHKIVWKTKIAEWVTALQMRLTRLLRVDQKALRTKITTSYKWGEQKSITKHTIHLTFSWIGHNSRRHHQIQHLPAKKKNLKKKDLSSFISFWNPSWHLVFNINSLWPVPEWFLHIGLLPWDGLTAYEWIGFPNEVAR